MTISYRVFASALLTLFTAGMNPQVLAGNLSDFSTLTQAEFLSLSKDLAAATSAKPIEPAAPMGISGFDVSGAAAITQPQASAAWSKVTGSSTHHLPLVKLSATKGLPWGVDVGLYTAKLPTTNVSATGFHAKYALVDGSTVWPAVALRASHSRMGGVSQMDLSNTSYDLLISKGFVGLTPYAGVGLVKSNASLKGVANLNSENFTQNRTFVGASWNLLLLNLSAEYERTGEISTYGLKAGLRF